MRAFGLPALILCLFWGAPSFGGTSTERVVESIDVSPVWSGPLVWFSLLTSGEHQFIAYYDQNRQMTVAHRRLAEKKWAFQKLPRKTGWDSHNYVTMALDRDGCLHLSGDMHVVPLVYFRTAKPYDITTFQHIPNMVGPERERRVTYPVFLKTREGALVFRYRDGASGRGSDLYNIYNEKAKQWKRLQGAALVSGEGRMNAYCTVPRLGPDGNFHMIWVWRDTPDAATNHDLSYARSRDLVHWETSAGKPLTLPITIKTCEIIDPVPAGGGMINGNTRVGFDSRKRPVVTYHKFDQKGNTQIYCARLEQGRWKISQTSDWEGYRWKFGGYGTLKFEVGIGRVVLEADGRLTLAYRNKNSSGTWVLDEETLKPVSKLPTKPIGYNRVGTYPHSILKVESKFPGMKKHVRGDLGQADSSHVRYVITWETLGTNKDRPRKGSLPESSMLQVVKLARE